MSSIIDINLGLIIYKSLFRSILTYASLVWGYTASIYVNKLQKFQNKVPRIITPILTLHEQKGILLIINHIGKLTKALHQKSADSENSQI
jgi:hypothetical protein